MVSLAFAQKGARLANGPGMAKQRNAKESQKE
jgi:hypothetical protein